MVRTPKRFPSCPKVTVDGTAVTAKVDRARRLSITVTTGSDARAKVRISARSRCSSEP